MYQLKFAIIDINKIVTRAIFPKQIYLIVASVT